jgi:hypothetical protein
VAYGRVGGAGRLHQVGGGHSRVLGGHIGSVEVGCCAQRPSTAEWWLREGCGNLGGLGTPFPPPVPVAEIGAAGACEGEAWEARAAPPPLMASLSARRPRSARRESQRR